MTGNSIMPTLVSEDRTGVRWMVRLAETAQPRFGESRLDLLVWEVVPYMTTRAGVRVFGQPKKQFPYWALPAAHQAAMEFVASYHHGSRP